MRDLLKDKEICDKATPGPWRWDKYCNLVSDYQKLLWVELDPDCDTQITSADDPDDDRFIVQAREGWPHAIERAIKAEAEVERLVKLLEKIEKDVKETYDEVCIQHHEEVERLKLMVKSITGGLDEAIETIHYLEAENAKLRKVADEAREFISFNGCSSKECKKCDPKYIGFCMWSGIGQALAELDKEGNKKD